MMKFNKGSALDVLNPGSSLNIGSRSYINGFDATTTYSPNSPNFVDESAADPQVLFTSIYDDPATTHARAGADQRHRRADDADPRARRCGAASASRAAESPSSTRRPSRTAAARSTRQNFTTAVAVGAGVHHPDDTRLHRCRPTATPTLGTHVYITNNNFFHNFDAAMQIEPNGLLAGDPLTPLASGHPFFRGNVMQGNGIDGLAVVTNRVYLFDDELQRLHRARARRSRRWRSTSTSPSTRSGT